MIKGTYVRNSTSFTPPAVMMCFLFIWNINSGSVHLSAGEIGEILLRRTGGAASYRIVWDIRLLQILSVVILGGALPVPGSLFQMFFADPIAGPSVLGISSGAKLVVSLMMVVLLGRGISIGSAGMILATFTGSMISMGFVLMISGKAKEMSMLVTCGVMISYICSAITDFVVTFAEDASVVNLHNWSIGSFLGTPWENVGVMTAVALLSLTLVFLTVKSIGAYQTGEVYAQNMGVNILRFRVALILLSSILSACVTAFAGPISFVGIAVPHLVKSLFKTAKPILTIPSRFLGGVVSCPFCDLTARIVFAPTEFSISSATAVFGAPVVIHMMVHNRKGMQ